MKRLLILLTLFAGFLPAQYVLFSCIPEPSGYKNVLQLGCDAYNQSGQSVTIPASELRRLSLQYLAAPLRPLAATAQITTENKRSVWSVMVQVLKWGGFAWSVGQGFIPQDRISDLERALPGGVSGAITLADSFIGKNRQDLTIPRDYLPESVTLASGESEAYTWFAMPQTSAKAFTITVAPPIVPIPGPTAPAVTPPAPPSGFVPASAAKAPSDTDPCPPSYQVPGCCGQGITKDCIPAELQGLVADMQHPHSEAEMRWIAAYYESINNQAEADATLTKGYEAQEFLASK